MPAYFAICQHILIIIGRSGAALTDLPFNGYYMLLCVYHHYTKHVRRIRLQKIGSVYATFATTTTTTTTDVNPT